MKHIIFKIIPVYSEETGNRFLVHKDKHFFEVSLTSLDFETQLLTALRQEFGESFLLARAFLVLNTDRGLIIYQFASPTSKMLHHTQYTWLTPNQLEAEQFNCYDEVAINTILTDFS